GGLKRRNDEKGGDTAAGVSLLWRTRQGRGVAPFFFQPGAPGKRRPVSPSDIGMQPCSSERRRVGAAPLRWATWFRASASSSSSTERGLPAARTEWTPTQNGRGGRRTVGRLRERRRR
ncbi:unnamed protein product, partial [Ixodes pacificus]